MTTLEEELLLANTKNATLKKDTDAKIKEQNDEIAMLEKDRFELIKVNMKIKKLEHSVHTSSVTNSNLQSEIFVIK